MKHKQNKTYRMAYLATGTFLLAAACAARFNTANSSPYPEEFDKKIRAGCYRVDFKEYTCPMITETSFPTPPPAGSPTHHTRCVEEKVQQAILAFNTENVGIKESSADVVKRCSRGSCLFWDAIAGEWKECGTPNPHPSANTCSTFTVDILGEACTNL